MKVFILCIIMMLPSGEATTVMTQVPKCPPYSEVTATIQKLKEDGVITDAVAACKPVQIARDA